MEKLTFKQYMESKAKLLEAIKETPVATSCYVVKRYCKVRVGETKEDRQEVALKPNNRILVEWRYDDIENPEPESITFDDESPEEFPVYWSGAKLSDWLSKNAVEDVLF